MPIKSPISVESCPRCAKPIKSGSYVETYGRAGGQITYAHHGCKPYIPPAPLPAIPKNARPRPVPGFIPPGDDVLPADPEYQYGSAGKYGESGAGGGSPLGSPVPGAGMGEPEVGNGEPDDGEGEGESRADDAEESAHDAAGRGTGREPPPPKPGAGTDAANDDEVFDQIVNAAAGKAADRLAAKSTQIIAAAAKTAMEKADAKMTEFIGDIAKSVAGKVTEGVNETIGEKLAETVEAAEKMFAGKMEELREMSPVKHEIIVADFRSEFDETEVFHYAFDETLMLLANGFNVFLPGETGCGKTHMAEQCSRALGLRFGMLSGSAGITESHLFGTSYPNVATGENVYLASEFIEMYENGGLFLLDEMDAIDPNTLLSLNSAVENGYCSIPRRYGNPRAVRHAEFKFLGAANTFGHGANRMYCGRNKLDEATIERFRAGTVPMGYDPRIERRVCPDNDLYRILTGWRTAIAAKGYQRVLSTRFCGRAFMLKTLGYSVENIAAKLAGGWAKKEIHDVFGFQPVDFSQG